MLSACCVWLTLKCLLAVAGATAGACACARAGACHAQRGGAARMGEDMRLGQGTWGALENGAGSRA